MKVPQVNGLYRLCPGAEIEECIYDFETGKIAELVAKSPYPYLPEYYAARGAIPKYHMYKAILDHDECLGVFNCNNTYLMRISAGGIFAENWSEDEWEWHELPVQKPRHALMHVGWVLTKPASPDMDIIPYKLFYDGLTGCIRLKGRWIPVKGPFTINPDMSSYKDLINTNHAAVYVTASGERRYLDG